MGDVKTKESRSITAGLGSAGLAGGEERHLTRPDDPCLRCICAKNTFCPCTTRLPTFDFYISIIVVVRFKSTILVLVLRHSSPWDSEYIFKAFFSLYLLISLLQPTIPIHLLRCADAGIACSPPSPSALPHQEHHHWRSHYCYCRWNL